MKDIWVVADSIVSPLGSSTGENFLNVVRGNSGVTSVTDPGLSKTSVMAGQIKNFSARGDATRLEAMCLHVLGQLTERIKFPSERTVLVVSTTKGNIDLLKTDQNNPKIHLHAFADFLAQKIGLSKSIVVSNACISGVMAIAVGARMIQRDEFDHAIILGADELTGFVVSGFQSLAALSDERCRPFDASRKGINLGEAAAALVISSKPQALDGKPTVRVSGFGFSNDANHISGPSRTGEELAAAIRKALESSKLTATAVDFISAHGTATPYNDEMESKAFDLAGLNRTPMHSLKANYGHTLGAAGVLESILGIEALKSDQLLPSLGFSEPGVSKDVTVTAKAEKRELHTFLKTASGFGGCNAAIVFQKVK